MFFRIKLKQYLEKAIHSRRMDLYFQDLRQSSQILASFTTAAQLAAALHGRQLSLDRQDEILLALVCEHQKAPCTPLHELLLHLLWPALESIFLSRLGGRTPADDLWDNIQWAFVCILDGYPADRRPSKVARNIQLDVLKKVTRWAGQDARYALFLPTAGNSDRNEHNYEALLDGRFEHFNEILAGKGKTDEREPDAEDIERMIQVLRGFLDAGVISEDSFYILIATRVYGKSVKDHAAARSLPYQTIKKRRQRAEAAIRAELKERFGDDVPFAELGGVFGPDET